MTRRTPLTAVLTLLAVLASTFAVAGCGGKSGSSETQTTTGRKHSTKPAY